MKNPTVKFLEKTNDYQNETTNYKFNVGSEEWAISDCNGELTLLDSNSYIAIECNNHERIKDLLLPLYEKHIND